MSSEEDWDDWLEEETEPVSCLFCSSSFPTPSSCYEHCASKHGFDYPKLRVNLKLDEYGHVKIINYIRSQVKAKPALANVTDFNIDENNNEWKNDVYLKPVLESDPLLYSGYDDDVDGAEENQISQLQISESTENKLARLEQELKQARLLLQETLLADEKKLEKKNKGDGSDDEDDEDEYDQDHGYFEAYGGPYIHDVMLKDKVRTESYRDFFYQNPQWIKDKVVLDVGCGTGILCMFASSAGARHVIGVDNSRIIEKAKSIVNENKISNILLLQNKIENLDHVDGKQLDISIDKVDVIVSEWMGYCLLFESMLSSIIIARDKFLKPGGSVFPDIARMYLCAISDDQFRKDKFDFWDDVYGFKMSAMKEDVLKECFVETVNVESINSNVFRLKELNVNTVSLDDLDFSSEFQLTVSRDSMLDGFVCYFDVEFSKDCVKPIIMETGPFTTQTHWAQTIFLWEKRIAVCSGDVIEGSFICKRHMDYYRDLNITLKFRVGSNESVFVQSFVLR